MRWLRLAAVLLSAGFVWLAPAVHAFTAQTDPALQCPLWAQHANEYLGRLEARLAHLVNTRRGTTGAEPVELDARLSKVARGHSRYMAERGHMGHVTATGKTITDRLQDAGILDWDTAAENLAMGRSVSYTSQALSDGVLTVYCHEPESLAEEIFHAWLGSPGHSRVLHDPVHTHVGSGTAYDKITETVFVTHDFARLVACGFPGAPCCPPPQGQAGGVCRRPARCVHGLCRLAAPPSAETKIREATPSP